MDGCERLRTVANGCGTVADGCERLGNVERTPSTPRPQSETGTLATHSGKTPPKWKPKSYARCSRHATCMMYDDDDEEDDEEEEEDNHDHLEAGKFPMMIL